MIGLKTYAPALARVLSTTPDALYERQRKLASAGLLTSTSGRGPGSGVRVTATTVSMLIVACLATDGLANIDVIVKRIFDQKSDDGKCLLTGAATFGEALSLILSSSSAAAPVRSVRLLRTEHSATILFQRKGRKAFDASYFGRRRRSADDPGRNALEVEAHLPGVAIQSIAADLEMIAAADRSVATKRSNLK